MQGYKKGHDYGPTWRDVFEQIQAFRSSTNRLVKVEMALTAPANGPGCLYWRVVSYTRDNGKHLEGERAEGHAWPASEWATVPAMLWALLYRLEYRLTQEQMSAEAQAHF